MKQTFTTYIESMDQSVRKDLDKLNEEIEDLKEEEQIDKEKLMELELKRRYRAMEMGSLYGRTYKSMYPW